MTFGHVGVPLLVCVLAMLGMALVGPSWAGPRVTNVDPSAALRGVIPPRSALARSHFCRLTGIHGTRSPSTISQSCSDAPTTRSPNAPMSMRKWRFGAVTACPDVVVDAVIGVIDTVGEAHESS